MFDAAWGVFILIGLTWDVGKALVLFYFGVFSYLFGDRCGIFMDNSGDCSKGITVVQSFFYVNAVGQSQMFLITFLSIQWSSLSGTGKVIISLCSIAVKMCGGKVSPCRIYRCNMEFSSALNSSHLPPSSRQKRRSQTGTHVPSA